MKINVPADKALAQLRKALEQIAALMPLHKEHPDFIQWHENILSDINNIYGNDSDRFKAMNALGFSSPIISLGISSSDLDNSHIRKAYLKGLNNAEAKLKAMIREIETYHSDSSPPQTTLKTLEPMARIETICQRFHRFVLALKKRHGNRPLLIIKDEYDVQYLFGALLKIDFEDVMPEQWTPSYAGGSARMDFLLKAEGIVVEVKKTRKGLSDKQIGDQLIVDIERYKNHTDCKCLVCFVYDPENHIRNAVGLTNDLSRETDGFIVRVIVNPTH